MNNLFKASLFKLRHDITFRVTMIIGLGLAVFMTLIYFIIDKALGDIGESTPLLFCTGQNMFFGSLSPVQNFGIAIPVNLVSFTVLEFNHGLIRNKIIAGNSKGKIYVSLFISGLIFTLIVLSLYALLSFGLGCAFGGFDPNGFISAGTATGQINAEFAWKFILLTVVAYVFVTSFTIFFATLFRNIGPCIPIVILTLFMAYLVSTILPGISESAEQVLRVVNPMHYLSGASLNGQSLAISNETFFGGLGSNLVYAGAFFVAGFFIFRKRDVK